MHGAHGAHMREGRAMATLKEGKFDCVIVDRDGYWKVTTSRSSVVAMLEDKQTAKVTVWADGLLLKTYVRMGWAVKLLQFIPSGSVNFVIYTKEVFNHGA